MKMEFHHVGMACRRIAAELPELAVIGYQPEGPLIEDQIQQVRIQFVTGGGPRIELIEPAGPQSPVDGVLKRGSKFYHLAYEVERLDEAVEHLKSSNFNPVAAPAPATAFGMNVAVYDGVAVGVTVTTKPKSAKLEECLDTIVRGMTWDKVPSLNQADGIHPTAEGQRKLAETVWKALQPLLTS